VTYDHILIQNELFQQALRAWDKKGILKAVRFGQRKDRRYKKEDITRLLNNHK
jgi:DNA-binding transcriptional MerR regulator